MWMRQSASYYLRLVFRIDSLSVLAFFLLIFFFFSLSLFIARYPLFVYSFLCQKDDIQVEKLTAYMYLGISICVLGGRFV